MKTTMIKLITLIFMATLLFSGCGGSDKGSSTSQSTSVDDTETSVDDVIIKNGETFSDTDTGLEWQMFSDTYNAQLSWDDAILSCKNLVYNDKDDWRLPSKSEFISLQNKFTSVYIGDETSNYDHYFWTSSEYDATQANTLQIQWWNNILPDFWYKTADKNDGMYGWDYTCVRGTQIESTTIDATTNIEWQDSPENISAGLVSSVQEAIEYCETLVYSEDDDWYLPSNEIINSTDFSTFIYFNGEVHPISDLSAADDAAFQEHLAPRCARDGYFANNSTLHGRWAYVDSGSAIVINNSTFFKSVEVVDENHIKVVDSNNVTKHLIRAGIANVKLKGELANISDTASLSPSRISRSGTSSIGGLDLILKNAAQNEEKTLSVESTADTSLIGKIQSDTLYVADPATTNGRLVIPDNSELTMPTGDTQVTLRDSSDNNATFTVSVIGEETDMGVLTVTDKAYNFKSYIEHGNDWRYFGYNDGETAIEYTKVLKICNVGTSDISGVSFEIALDSNATDVNRTFSTDYDGSAVPFASGECKSYDTSFSFTRPTLDKDVKINITINDNFTGLIWNDYASLKLSQYPHHNLYFNSNVKTLNGFLVAPGRNLINVQFSNSSYNNYVRVPLVQTDEYDVIISTPNITDEDVYMISSGLAPDTTKMDGFTAVLTNEPDNNESSATKLALFEGESVAYLHQGDIDFYKIVDKPNVRTKVSGAYVDFNISVPMATDINASTVNTNTVTFSSIAGTVAGTATYDVATKTIIFNSDVNLTSGTHTIALSKDLQSATGYKLENDLSFDINIIDYPLTAQIIANLDTKYIREISVSGNFAYVVADNYYGLNIIDISNPILPLQIGKVTNIDYTFMVTILGDYAYVACGNSGLKIIDISNPLVPLIVSTVDTPGSAYGVAVSGNYAYVADYGSGLQIIDITDPSSPILKETVDTEGYAYEVTVTGNFAYVADGGSGLQIIDISDPAFPELNATINTSSSARGVTVSGNFAYIADGGSGLQIIDITNPSSPILKGALDTEGYAYGVTVSENFAYVADGVSGLQIIDITDPTSPLLVNTIDTTGSAEGITISGNFAYVADDDAGLQIINIQMYK